MSVPSATEFAPIVVVTEMLPEPLMPVAVPVTSPESVRLRAVCQVVAVLALPLRAAVIVPAEKFPEASRATIVLAVFAFVAFEVTVKVEPSPEAEPERPTPLTAPVAI